MHRPWETNKMLPDKLCWQKREVRPKHLLPQNNSQWPIYCLHKSSSEMENSLNLRVMIGMLCAVYCSSKEERVINLCFPELWSKIHFRPHRTNRFSYSVRIASIIRSHGPDSTPTKANISIIYVSISHKTFSTRDNHTKNREQKIIHHNFTFHFRKIKWNTK